MYSGDTLGTHGNNAEMKNKAKNDAMSLKEKVVKPNLQLLKLNLNQN
jgi:hypothetical protein